VVVYDELFLFYVVNDVRTREWLEVESYLVFYDVMTIEAVCGEDEAWKG
jgi:hypothetical protein